MMSALGKSEVRTPTRAPRDGIADAPRVSVRNPKNRAGMTTPARASRRTVLLGAALAAVGGVAGTTRRSAAAPDPSLPTATTTTTTPGSTSTTTTVAGATAAGAPLPIEQSASVTRRAKRLRQMGSLLFPMGPEPTCYILNNFGDSRSGGRAHEGVDIMATLGQEVYAVVDGTLTSQAAIDSPLSGNAWGLTAALDGTYYFFAHLSGFADGLQVGDTVTRGQLIGYVGDTGNPGTGNYHLHFEIHPRGQKNAAVDPVPFLEIPTACTLYAR
jgi:murein DD-endopeptidase MepM/ murein hydrolase activator NlpD